MWIVYWTTQETTGLGGITTDHYHITEDEEAAKTIYESWRMRNDTYTAGYAKIVESTEAHHTDEPKNQKK